MVSRIESDNLNPATAWELKEMFKWDEAYAIQRVLKAKGTYKWPIDWKIWNGTFGAYEEFFWDWTTTALNVDQKVSNISEEIPEYTEESVMLKLEGSKGDINSSKDLWKLLSKEELIIMQTIAKDKWYYKWSIDWKTWPNSFDAYEQLLWIVHLNGKMRNESEYRKRFSAVWHSLEADLWVPRWSVNSIIKKETTFWTNLNSKTGSKWMMQLTIHPLNDMIWKTSIKVDWKWRAWPDNMNKVLKYKELFQRIDLSKLKSLDNGIDWVNWTIEDSMWQEVWEKLEDIQDPNIWSEETAKLIKEIKWILKNPRDKYTYVHTLNMIVWTVYFTRLYERNWDSLEKAAINYNWDNKIYKWDWWKPHKYNYWSTVMKYYQQEKNK